MDELLDPARLMSTVRERDGIALTVPAFHVADVEIWGATRDGSRRIPRAPRLERREGVVIAIPCQAYTLKRSLCSN